MHPTVDDIVKAYNDTGLEPAPHIYYDKVANCGCATGVYAIANGAAPNKIGNWLAENVDESYRHGIVFGFDGYDGDFANISSHYSPNPDSFRHGYMVGMAVRERLGV